MSTPGPWAIARTNNGTFIRNADSNPAGYLAEVRACRNEKQCLADARLIASAPELLEALEQIVDRAAYADDEDVAPDVRSIALAAILKARGEA